MANWSTVECAEVLGTRVEARDWKQGPRTEVDLECAYADRHALSEDLFLNGVWPFTPVGKAAPVVQSIGIRVDMEQCTTTGQSIDYNTAILHVVYGYNDSAGEESGSGSGTGRQYYTEELIPHLEVISLQDQDYYVREEPPVWPTFVRKLDETNYPNYRQYTFSIVRTFFNWLSVPDEFRTFKGSVNDAQVTFPSLGLTFEAEELLFLPRNARKSVSSEGTDGYTVQVEFIEREGGWNKYVVDGSQEPSTLWYVDGPINLEASWKQVVNYPLEDFSGWIF